MTAIPSYQLTGRFIECCNCKVICPCWVDDRPTEDHCAGFFAWTFDAGSHIDGDDVGDRHVVVVTVHSDRRLGGTSESVLFVDDRLGRGPAHELMRAFSMNAHSDRHDPLADLGEVLGYPVAAMQAPISVQETDADGFDVTVSYASQVVVEASMRPAKFDSNANPLTLSSTALDKEMGTTGGVAAHRTSTFALNVAALPGTGTELIGRSGMVGRFAYRYDAPALVH